MLELEILNAKFTKKLVKFYEKKITKIDHKIRNRTGEGHNMLDWLKWSENYYKHEVEGMKVKVKELKEDLKVEKLLVIGIGGSYLGSRAAIEFVNGSLNNDDIIFAGINMSEDYYKQVEAKLSDTKWAIAVISKSGTTLEPALAFRHFKSILSSSVGVKELSKYIVAITDKEDGALRKTAIAEGYTSFTIPDGIGGRFSGITPVGLFPMAFAGLNIDKFLNGLKNGYEDFGTGPKDNLAYKYAISRFLINKDVIKGGLGKDIEIFTAYDPDLTIMGEWWKQLFGESEGKDGKGIFPASAIYSTDLHSLGQYIQEGTKNIFETTVWVNEEKNKIVVKEDKANYDGLNYLKGMSMHEINEKAFDSVVKAHIAGGNPNIIIKIDDKSEETLGYLWYFFFMAVSMSGYLLGVNPFDQPGVEEYKREMFKSLGKPQ